MPSRFRLRIVFKPLVLGTARCLAKVGITPNQATGMMLALSIACVVYFLLVPMSWFMLIGFGILVFITGVFDGVDGAIARLTSAKTRFGAVLDSSMDRISDPIIFFVPAIRELLAGDVLSASWLHLPILWDVPLWAWSFMLVVGAYMTSYVRTRATLADSSLDADIGLLGRSERLFLVVVASVVNILPLAIVVLAILTNITAVFRIKDAKKGLAGKVD
ncbi:MAG TPA: CDP-alcohol phosphatidyltransferase family protein [Candidatus Lokiarchaeia archaeon]|nr:CDP-alcohol phosphatidyltransferase family protein [Candidatus Lokiarchaeia archaeon]